MEDTLARLRALAEAKRAEAWEKGRPRQRAADKRRRLAKAEAAYLAMPKLLGGPVGVERAGTSEDGSSGLGAGGKAQKRAGATSSGQRTPNPPGEKLDKRSRGGRNPLGLPPFVNPRPPTPAPGREPFDTLFTDLRHLRGDLRMVRTAIRQDRVPDETRAALVEKLLSILDLQPEIERAKGTNRAAWALIRAVQCLVDGVGMDQREEFREYRREHGYGARGPMKARRT